MEECEEELQKDSMRGNEMVTQLIQQLGSAITYPDVGNFRGNQKLWDQYASKWKPEEEWVRKMAKGSQAGAMAADGQVQLDLVGDEWSVPAHVSEVISDFILPFVGPQSQVCEIGCGGGRIAKEVVPLVKHLTLVDASEKMIERCREGLGRAGLLTRNGSPVVSFTHLSQPCFPPGFVEHFDFVYCFDVLVHMDLHLIASYLKQIAKLLKKTTTRTPSLAATGAAAAAAGAGAQQQAGPPTPPPAAAVGDTLAAAAAAAAAAAVARGGQGGVGERGAPEASKGGGQGGRGEGEAAAAVGNTLAEGRPPPAVTKGDTSDAAPGVARAFISTANLLSPLGWERFEKQSKYTVGGFYFVSPDIVRRLVDAAGMVIVKEAPTPSVAKGNNSAAKGNNSAAKGNMYYARDFLAVLELKQ